MNNRSYDKVHERVSRKDIYDLVESNAICRCSQKSYVSITQLIKVEKKLESRHCDIDY